MRSTRFRRAYRIVSMRYQLMAVIFVGMLAFAFPRTSSSQDASGPKGAGSGVTLVKFTYPIYPDVAAKAHISGEVVLMLGIQPDGSLVSADVVSGPAMLQESAVQSARQSKYECRGCGQGVTSYRMRYVFIFVDDGSCQPNAIPSANGDRQDQPEPPPSVDPSGPVVTTTRYIVCLVDPVTTIHTRSLKCLYFWRCRARRVERTKSPAGCRRYEQSPANDRSGLAAVCQAFAPGASDLPGSTNRRPGSPFCCAPAKPAIDGAIPPSNRAGSAAADPCETGCEWHNIAKHLRRALHAAPLRRHHPVPSETCTFLALYRRNFLAPAGFNLLDMAAGFCVR